MGLPVPIETQARRLDKYGIDKQILALYLNVKDNCKDLKNSLKKEKLLIQQMSEKIKADILRLRSKGITLKPSEMLMRRALKKEINAQKKVLKIKKLNYESSKNAYKKQIANRKSIRRTIKEEYSNNKENIIEDIRDEKANRRKRRIQKLQKAGITIKDTAKATATTIKDTATTVKDTAITIKDKVTDLGGNIKDTITNREDNGER